MPFLVALATIAGGIIFWMYRARAAADAAHELSDMASDVLAAARRFGFRRRHDMHPVDSVDDIGLAQGALSVAFLEQGAAATEEQRKAHLRALQTHLNVDANGAEEILVLGHWLVNECNGPAAAVTRLGKRLLKLGNTSALDPALSVINDVAAARGDLTESQRDALHELATIFRRR